MFPMFSDTELTIRTDNDLFATAAGQHPADGLTGVDLGRVTADDYSALCRLARTYVDTDGAGDLAHDAFFFLAHALRAADDWTPVEDSPAGSVSIWIDERLGRRPVPVRRDTLLRWAIDEAAGRVGLDTETLLGREPAALRPAA